VRGLLEEKRASSSAVKPAPFVSTLNVRALEGLNAGGVVVTVAAVATTWFGGLPLAFFLKLLYSTAYHLYNNNISMNGALRARLEQAKKNTKVGKFLRKTTRHLSAKKTR